MDIKILVTSIILALINVPEVTSYSIANAGSLHTALTYGYNNLLRPSGTTAVTVRFNLVSINSVDISKQLFSVTGWFDVGWQDAGRFTWTPSSYGNIEEMFMDYDNTWNPRVLVENTVDDTTILNDAALMFRVSYTGQIDWSPSGTFIVYCSMDISDYPFDKQTCSLSVKSGAFDSATVSLSLASTPINTDFYTENDEWELTSTSTSSSDVTQNSLTYNNLKFKFTVKRKSALLMVTLVLPLVLTSFLGMLVFAVPLQCESKLGYAVAILLVETVLLNIVLEEAPSSGKYMSNLGMFILTIVILSGLEVLMTIVILKLYYNTNKNTPMTPSSVRLASVLSAITCDRNQDGRQTGSRSTSPSIESADTELEKPQTIEDPPNFKTSIKRKSSLKSISPDCSFATSRNEDFRKGVDRQKAWSDGGLCGGGSSNRKLTWDDVARSVDRFCFFVFFILRLVFTVVFMTILQVGRS